MKNIQAIVFDLDNTLIDRREGFLRYAALFIENHFGEQALPQPKESMINRMVELDRDGYANKITLYQTLIDEWGMEGMTAESLNKERRACFHCFNALYPGVYKTLAVLKQRYKMGIITNGDAGDLQNAKIDEVGIRGFFETVLVSGDIGIEKPDPEIFLMMCRDLGAHPDQTVYVGDHYANDIVGATQAGLRAVWFPNDPVDDGVDNLAYATIEHFEQLMDIFSLNDPSL